VPVKSNLFKFKDINLHLFGFMFLKIDGFTIIHFDTLHSVDRSLLDTVYPFVCDY